MNSIISGMIHWLPEASAQSAFVILGILLLRALAGGRVAPAWWRWLWCLALLRLFAPVSALPPNPVCLQNIPAVEQSAAALVPSATVENFNRSLTVTPPLTASAAKPFPWATVLFSVWLAGAMLGWTLLAVTHWRFYKKLHRRPADADIEKIWRDCCRRFGVKRPPALCRADAVTSPALVGLFAPALLLPEKMPDGLTVSDWEHIFAHELAHYRRRDHWLNAAWLLALTVHWFNPLVWLGYRQLRIDRELAADEWALRRLAADRQRDYGNTLFKLATVSASGPATLMVGVLENHAQLKQRLRRIVNFTPRTALATVSGLLIVSVAAVLFIGKKPTVSDDYQALTAQEKLIAAAARDDLPEVRQSLRAGADINGEVSDSTALINAASRGHAGLIAWLLKHGANPNARNRDNRTPLMFASNAAVVDALAAGGADVHATTAGGAHNVWEENYFSYPYRAPDVLQALVRHGAKFDAKGDDGSFLMIRAAISNNVELARFLLAAGVDPNTPGRLNKHGDYRNKPLPMCASGDNYEVAKLLLEHGAAAGNGQRAALSNRKSRMVKFFWELGIRDIPELSYAVSQHAAVSELRKLTDSGAPVNPKSPDGYGHDTPLYIAARFGDLDAVKFLLDCGADTGLSVQAAASEGQDEILELLLRHGAKASASDITQAASNGNPYDDQRGKEHFERCVKILLDAGALKKAQPKDIGSALYFSVFTRQPGGNLTILKMLLDAGCDPNSPIEFSDGKKVWKSSPSVLEYCREESQAYLGKKGWERLAEQLKASLDLLEAYAKPKARNSR